MLSLTLLQSQETSNPIDLLIIPTHLLAGKELRVLMTPVVKPPATEEDKLHRTKMG
jgi:hypothetical protein